MLFSYGWLGSRDGIENAQLQEVTEDTVSEALMLRVGRRLVCAPQQSYRGILKKGPKPF